MKRWMMIAALAASSVGCVANQGDAPVRFLDARSLSGGGSEACVLGDTQIPAGTLDISGGTSYLLGLRVETNTSVQETRVGGVLLGGGGLNDFSLREQILTYEAEGVTLPAEERIPLYGVFRPGTSAEAGSYALLYALGPEALDALRDKLVVSRAPDTGAFIYPEPVTVLATIKASGILSSGQKVETNEVTFPITVFSSGYTPATGACQDATLKPAQTGGACGNVAQDNGPICRRPAPTTP